MSGSTLTALDPRLLSVSFEVNGQLNTFDQRFWIKAKGCKYANQLQNECTVEISNLTRDTRNYILDATSPFNLNKTPKVLTLSAGRVSSGLFQVYMGNITVSKIASPPDINLTLKCGTSHFMKGKLGKRSGGGKQSRAGLLGNIASNLGLSLHNEATDKTIANYAHTGNALDEVGKMHETGCDCFVDDNKLIAKNRLVPLAGDVINLSESTGMIKVPEVTEKGLRVTFLYVNQARLGGAIQITSNVNPSANGLYVIYKLNFALSSRENEFYYMAECLKAAT
jgi:hypothetical protein